jgi:ATP-binding cassette subfamily B (MDR/TAP) protein 1
VGIAFGLSQFTTFCLCAALFYFSALFQKVYTDKGQDSFIALFSLMYAAFQVGNAQSMGPDVGKAKKAAFKIFGYIDVESRINPMTSEGKPMGSFNQIEFKDVWFRYPAKKSHWVFKGLNLTVKKNESLAVVGESGAGKSTLVGLLLRFYDVTHGQILVDGVDIRDI